MTLDELNKLVRDTINATLNVSEVIAYHPNAPRPDADYCSVHISELVPIGNGDKNFSDNADDLDEKVVMQYEAMVSINFYRELAQQNAAMLFSVMRRNSVVDSFNASGVGFVRQSAIRDVTQLQDQGHEERGQVDLFLYFELTPVTEVVTGIDTARVVGEIDNSVKIIETIDISIGG